MLTLPANIIWLSWLRRFCAHKDWVSKFVWPLCHLMFVCDCSLACTSVRVCVCACACVCVCAGMRVCANIPVGLLASVSRYRADVCGNWTRMNMWTSTGAPGSLRANHASEHALYWFCGTAPHLSYRPLQFEKSGNGAESAVSVSSPLKLLADQWY